MLAANYLSQKSISSESEIRHKRNAKPARRSTPRELPEESNRGGTSRNCRKKPTWQTVLAKSYRPESVPSWPATREL
jgi:hypothetical protein